MLFWSCSSFLGWGQITLNGNYSWGNHPTLPGFTAPLANYETGIIITSGSSLWLYDITLEMMQGTSIIVEEGASLKLWYSTIDVQNSALNPNATWRGIRAKGNPNEEQYSQFPQIPIKSGDPKSDGQRNFSQTYIELVLHSSIKNASIGIQSEDGAIIQTKHPGITFEDCEIGIEFLPYRSTLQPKINASEIINSEFVWIKNSQNSHAKTGIKMTSVYGVRILSCEFRNLDPTQHHVYDRGSGIRALYSSFYAGKNQGLLCEDNSNLIDRPCLFENLSRGITAVGGLGGQFNEATVQFIQDAIFLNCFQSIELNFSDGTVISNNTITWNRNIFSNIFLPGWYSATFSSNIIALYHSENFIIYKNTILSSGLYHKNIFVTGSTNGKIVANTLLNDELTTSFNDEVFGVYLEQRQTPDVGNSNIKIDCNAFENQGVDIYIGEYTTGIEFGSANNEAGNIFSDVHPNRWSIKNESSTDLYYNLLSSNIQTNKDPFAPRLFSMNIYPEYVSGEAICVLSCEDFDIDWGFMNLTKIQDMQIKVYPNPNNGNLNIEIPSELFSEEYIHLQIFNQHGQQILNKELVKTSLVSENISNHPDGIYFVSILTPNYKISKKLVLIK